MNTNSSTAFKVFIFKLKEGRRRKRHAQPSQACVGGLGLIETPPAKRLESPSSPSPHFSCLLQALKKPRAHPSKGPGALATATASLASPEQWVHAPCAAPCFKASNLPDTSAIGVCKYTGCFPPGSLAHVERCLWDAVAIVGSFAAVTLPFLFCRRIHTSMVSGTHAGEAASCANYPVPCSDSSPSAHIMPLTL